MTMPASTMWEIREAGNADNGGGFAWVGLGANYYFKQSASGTNEWYAIHNVQTTKTLLRFGGTEDSTTISDETLRTWSNTGGALIKTSVTDPFGGSAGVLYLNGSHAIYTAYDSAFTLGTKAFTFEFRMKMAAGSIDYGRIMGDDDSFAANGSMRFVVNDTIVDETQGMITFGIHDGTYKSTTSTTAVNDGNWHHIAVCRVSNTITLYVDGYAEGTPITAGTVRTSERPLYIGGTGAYTSQRYVGYLDEFHFVDGAAKYTTDFTPSTSPVSYGALPLTSVGSVALTPATIVATEGTVGSLTAGQWDYADNDSLGFSTVYVRLSDGGNPNLKQRNWVKMQAGTDLSQQDTAQHSYTDLAIDGSDNTKITSAARAFTTADIGNIIKVTGGTGFTVQRRYIVSIDGSAAIMDGAMGTVGSTAGVGKLGGAMTLTGTNVNDMVAGNDVAIKVGTQTLTGTTTVANGLASNKIRFDGYQTTRGDKPTGTNRPLIACGAYVLISGNYNEFNHLRFTGTGQALLRLNAGSYANNVAGYNSSTTANRSFIEMLGAGAGVRRFYAKSDNGYGIRAQSNSNSAHYGFIEDCGVRGISNEGQRNNFTNIIITRCPTGVYTSAGNLELTDIDVHDCSLAGLDLTNASQHKLVNINLTDCAVGITGTAGSENSHFVKNLNFYNCTVLIAAALLLGGDYTEVDPGYADPDNNDFTPGTNAKGLITIPGELEGMKAGVTNHRDFAVMQRVEGAGGGGGQSAHSYVF